MAEIPIGSISWSIGSKIASYIVKKIKVEVTFYENSPTIKVVRDVALVGYQLFVRTHGWPRKYPRVTFSKVKGMRKILKKTVSPSTFGEINGSLRLKLYTHEIPRESDFTLNVDFEVTVDLESIIKKDYLASDILDRSHSQMEVLCSNSCNFPLEQVPIVIKKDENEQLSNMEVSILDRAPHNVISKLDPRATRKGDEYVKWYTSFKPNESILFKVVATWT